MGRKRTRAGKQIYFCLAGLILSGLAGCAFFRAFQEREGAQEALSHGRRLFAQGDYESSLRENQKVLSMSASQSAASEAIFTMGLIYAHAENPKRDPRRALGFFRKVISEHPQSPLADQARVWVGVLQMNERLTQIIEKSKQVDIEIEEKKRTKER